jgi:23S rRNA maturation mini-RNase III
MQIVDKVNSNLMEKDKQAKQKKTDRENKNTNVHKTQTSCDNTSYKMKTHWRCVLDLVHFTNETDIVR